MNRLFSGLALVLIPLAASAQSMKPRHVEQVDVDTAVPRIAVLLHARTVSRDLDGSHWVTHAVPAVEEPAAMGITRIAPDGSVQTLLASDLLPTGSILPGMAGQVYGVAAMTSPHHFAATVGWVGPDRSTHNALVLYRLEDDGSMTTMNITMLSNGGAVAGGPHDTVVVVTRDPAGKGRLARATIFDSLGEVQSDVLPFDAPDVRASAVILSQIRLQRTSENEFALLDLADKTLREFRITASDRLPVAAKLVPSTELRPVVRVSCVRATAEELWSRSIADPGVRGEQAAILAYDVEPASRTVTVARQLLEDGVASTVITRYQGEARSVWVGPVWQAALADRNVFTGLANTTPLFEQRVDF
jgi:hypothetical protein